MIFVTWKIGSLIASSSSSLTMSNGFFIKAEGAFAQNGTINLNSGTVLDSPVRILVDSQLNSFIEWNYFWRCKFIRKCRLWINK